MWENEFEKIRIRNIIIGVLLILVVVVLIVAMWKVNQRINKEDEQLAAIKVEQQQQLSEIRQEGLNSIQRAYETDLAAISQYMPGVVCWGDSLTAGSSGNVSYPHTLQKYINIYLCDIYDLRYSIENAAEYSWLDWDTYKVSIPVVNLGVGKENADTILGRAGVQPYIVARDFEIPASLESVPITLTAPDGKRIMPLVTGDMGLNPVTIAGVEGILTLEANNWERTYSFRRLEEGSAVSVEKGATVQVSSATEYQDYIHIVWLGANDLSASAVSVVEDVKLLLSRQLQNPDRYLVIGPCTYGNTWTASNNHALESIDSAMMQAFGGRYINVRKYLMEDGLKDAGISPTKLDTESLKAGRVPESFRSASGSMDLNGQAYDLIGKVVYERMLRLGFFEEIHEELGINEITREILKSEPDYFENMLRIG